MSRYDFVTFGNYTKDTIVSAAGTRHVDGGGYSYAAHAARLAGLRVAAVTRRAAEDAHIAKALDGRGHRRLRVRLAELDADAARVPDRERRRAHPVRQGRRGPDRPGAPRRHRGAHLPDHGVDPRRGERRDRAGHEGAQRAPRARRAGLRAHRDAGGPARVRGLAGARTGARHDRHPEDRRRRGGIPDRHRGHPRGRAHPRRARPARDRADAQGRPPRARERRLPRGGLPPGRAARAAAAAATPASARMPRNGSRRIPPKRRAGLPRSRASSWRRKARSGAAARTSSA